MIKSLCKVGIEVQLVAFLAEASSKVLDWIKLMIGDSPISQINVSKKTSVFNKIGNLFSSEKDKKLVKAVNENINVPVLPVTRTKKLEELHFQAYLTGKKKDYFENPKTFNQVDRDNIMTYF